MEHLFYKPSGKIPAKGIIISLIMAFVLTVVCSMLYIALQWFIPFIYFNLFITIGLGIAIALSLQLATGLGKIRNTKYDFVNSYSYRLWLNSLVCTMGIVRFFNV